MQPVQVRPATPADATMIAQVHVDTWRTSYAGLVSAHYLSTLSYARSAAHWRARLEQHEGFSFVATAGVEVVGFVAAGPGRDGLPAYPVELYALYVAAAYQRRGCGHQLVGAVVQRFLAEGETSLLVWTLAESPYRKFYEGLGGVRVLLRQIDIGGQPVHEVAYHWPTLTALLARTAPGTTAGA